MRSIHVKRDRLKLRLGAGVLLLLVLQGCRTLTPGGGLDPVALPQDTKPPETERVQIGSDKGRPVYALGGTSRIEKAAYVSKPEPRPVLKRGRFAYPDYTDPVLARKIKSALDKAYEGKVKFFARSPLSYNIETHIPSSPRTHRAIEQVVSRVAAEHTEARPGPDGKWRPDYAQISRTIDLKASPSSLTKLRQAQGSRREWVEAIVERIQSIPYGVPPNGFLYPDEVIAFNYGDCDSKSVLAAALFEETDPSLRYVFVDLPSADHLILGVGLEPLPGEKTVEVNGRHYVLVEISGPGRLPLGMVGKSSLAALTRSGSHAILPSGKTMDL